MRKIFTSTTIAAVLFSLCSPLLYSQTYSLVFFPFSAAEEQTEQAEMLEDLLRVELINSNRITLIDRSLVDQTLADLGVYDAETGADEEQLKTAARQLDTDLYLTGHVGQIENSSVVTLELISVGRAVSLYTQSYDLGESLRRDARRLGAEIIDAVAVAKNVRLDDIRTLIEMQKYQDADTLLKRYSIFNPMEEEADSLKQMIDKGLAEKAFTEAEEYRNLFLFDEALIAVNQAISYEPENSFYKETARTIQAEALEFQQVEVKEIIQAIQELVDERRFRVAQGLLEALYNRGAESKEVRRLNEEVRQGLREQEHLRNANLAYFNRDYLEARLELREAIRINPEEPEYARFMERIDIREKKRKESRLRWNAYRGEFISLEPVDLFLDKKRLKPMPYGGILFGNWSYRNKNTLEIEEFNITAIEGGYTWKSMLPVLLSTELADPYLGYGYGGRLGTFFQEESEEYTDGSKELEGRRFIKAQGFGRGDLDIMVLSFLFNLGLEAGIGITYDKLQNRLVVAEPENITEEVSRELALLIHYGVRYGLSWMVNETFRVDLNWLKQYVRVFPDRDMEQYRYFYFTLGGGFVF